MAIASLCLGIGSFVVCFILAIPAIICGHLALGEIKRSNGAVEGKPMAIIGLVIGYLYIALLLVVIVIATFVIGKGAMVSKEASSHANDYAWDERTEFMQNAEPYSSSSEDLPAEEPASEDDQ